MTTLKEVNAFGDMNPDAIKKCRLTMRSFLQRMKWEE